MTRLALVGTGLIGGSVALAARQNGIFDEVVGIDTNPDAARQACRIGVIDAVADDVDGCSGVCVAVPMAAVAERVGWALERVGSDVPVFDVGSVKAPVLAALEARCGSVAPNFVPCHPISGSERQGSGAARANLFQGRSVVVTPVAATAPEALARVEGWWNAMGARVTRRDAETHDRLVALTSHLPHLAAFAFMKLVGEVDAVDVDVHAGGGFRDFTRIAGSDPVVWGDILTQNARFVGEHLTTWITELERLAQLCRDDPEALHERLTEARDLRRGITERAKR